MQGLVLEGGAMRGMFTTGVLDVFMENKIKFDGCVGVSAGAIFGSNYKSNQIGRGVRYNKKYCNDKRYSSFSSLIKTGDIYNAEFCYKILPSELDIFDTKAFQKNPMEFYVVCTDVLTGNPVYHKIEKGDETDIQWIRASASMPIVSNVVEIGENMLLDGGVADSIPLKYFESKGYKRNVVVLTQPIEYRKKKNKLVPVAKVMLKKYPELINAMADRHIRYNQTLDYILEQERQGKIFVIRPEAPLNIGSIEKDPNELERVYQLGRKAALDKLEELSRFMSL